MKNRHHRNRVRITGGVYRSRLVAFDSGEGLRPTADMVRERLFNILGQNLDGQKVLDLFAGSGVLSFEAASRGAASVTAVERRRTTCERIRDNARLLACDRVSVFCGDALAFLARSEAIFDLVFLDPPYAWRDWDFLWTALAPRLADGATVYAESDREICLPDYCEPTHRGRSGISRFALARKKPEQGFDV